MHERRLLSAAARTIAAGVATLTLVGMAETAAADPILIDFSSGTGDDNTFYIEDGFRFRPELGDHFENNLNDDGRFSWHDGSGNAPPNIITMDLADGSGGAFTVYEVDIVRLTFGAGGIVFRDSNGNSIEATATGTQTLNFGNTTFLQFQISNTGNNDFPISIDSLLLDGDPLALVDVPAPATLPLLAAGLLGLAGARRRRRG